MHLPLWRSARLGVCVAAAVILAALPVESLDSATSICIIKALTGRPCLGCGFTHAVSALLHGGFGDAVRYNHLILLAVPLVMGTVVRDMVRVWRSGTPALPS